MTEPLPNALAAVIPRSIPRTALVTGGARRVGRAICQALSQAGFAVAVHCRDSRDAAEQTAAELRAAGGQAIVVACDLADEAAVGRLLPLTGTLLGPVGVLVNNASVFEPDEIGSATRSSWDAHIEPNLRAPFVLTQAFAALLPEDAEGVVVNLLDQRVWSPTGQFLSYTVSKMGLWALTQTLALALAPRIRVAGIGPGPTVPSARQSEASFARQAESVPLGHGSSPEEVARAVLAILALPAFTGQMLALDGGQHLQWWPRRGQAAEE